jgi:hypothetical protein
MKRNLFFPGISACLLALCVVLAGCELATEDDPYKLRAGVWVNGIVSTSDSEDWYSFEAAAGIKYYIWWDDVDDGSGTKTGDIDVRLTYPNGSYSPVYDQGWTTGYSYTPTTNGTIKIRVRPCKASFSFTGTYAIVYSLNSTRPAVSGNLGIKE